MKPGTISASQNVLRLEEGRWAIMHDAFPKGASPAKLELILTQTTAVIVFPLNGEAISPYLIMHIPDFISTGDPVDLAHEHSILKERTTSKYRLTFEMVLNLYKELLMSQRRQEPKLGVYMLSGETTQDIDIALLEYLRLDHYIMQGRLWDPVKVLLDPQLGTVTSSSLNHPDNPRLYHLGSKFATTETDPVNFRDVRAIFLSPPPYH